MRAPKVNLTKMAKVNGKWQRYPIVLNSNGSIKPGYILLDGRPMSAPEGNYMLDWYENGKKTADFLSRKLTEQTLKNASSSVDAGSLLFAHSVLEDGLNSFLGITSDVAPEFLEGASEEETLRSGSRDEARAR